MAKKMDDIENEAAAVKPPQIAVLTMVWNDLFFLRRWLAYYGAIFGEENLYVLNHGGDLQTKRVVSRAGANVLTMPRDPEDIRFDARRWETLSHFTNGLLEYHDAVLCMDVDEFILPAREEVDLPRTIAALSDAHNYCVPGFELFPAEGATPENLEGDKLSLLVGNAEFSSVYSKSCIIKKLVRFGPGGHGLYDEDPQIAPDLALFHLKYIHQEEALRRNAIRVKFARRARQKERNNSTAPISGPLPLRRWVRSMHKVPTAGEPDTAAEWVEWHKIVPAAVDVLEQNRTIVRARHQFQKKTIPPMKSRLPEWMADLF